MAMVINTNVQSLNAQRNLNISQSDQKQAMDRLTSGKRINSAADDAAGLQIASGLTSQIRGLDQAVRNANDGISMVQTAEGALQESSNMLQRMRELSIQSASGTFTEGNRSSLNAEVSQLKEELTRIAETTTFNGLNILNGTLGSTSLQVGSEANQTIGVDFGSQSFAAEDLGGAGGGDVTGAVTSGADLLTGLQALDGTTKMSVNGQDVGDLVDATIVTLDDALATMNSNVSGVEISAFTEMTAGADGTGIIRGTDELNIALANADGTATTFQITDTGSMTELVDKINAEAQGQLKASLNDDGRLVLASSSGAQITITDGTGASEAAAAGFTTADVGNAQLSFKITDPTVESVDIAYTAAAAGDEALVGVLGRTGGDITGDLITTGTAITLAEGDLNINGVDIGAVAGGASATLNAQALVAAINLLSDEHGVVASESSAGVLKLDSVDGSEIQIALKGGATLANTGLIESNNASTVGNSVADIDITTAAGAQDAIETIDAALGQINAARGEMGAVTNRLNFTVNNLSSVSQAASASRSRIEDADFAAESANLSRAQVLQQAGTAMLAQANSAPQQVLSLLQ